MHLVEDIEEHIPLEGGTKILEAKLSKVSS